MYRSFLHNRSFMFRVYVLFWYWQLAWEKSWDVKQFMVTITHKLCRNLPFTSVFFATHTGYSRTTGLKNMSFQQEMLNTRKGHSGGKRQALKLTKIEVLYWLRCQDLFFGDTFKDSLIHWRFISVVQEKWAICIGLWIIRKVCLDYLKKRNISSDCSNNG